MTPRRTIAIAAVACSLAAVSCTSSGGPDAVHRTLDAVVLQLHDFPPSWRAYDAPAGQPDVLGEMAQCTGDARNVKQNVAAVRSREFRSGRLRVTSMAVALETQEAVTQRVNSLGDRKAGSCLATVLHGQVSSAVPGGSTLSQHYTVVPGGYNVAVNYVGDATGVVKMSVEGAPVNVYVDVAFLTGRDFYASVTFIGVGTRLNKYARAELTNDVAARAQRT